MYQEDYLSHHGILGQKWGIRRYQNEDGSLTDAGRKKYAKDIEKAEANRHKEVWKNPKNFRGVSRNVYDLKESILDNELRNTKEFKEYQKALFAREDAEIAQREGRKHISDREHDALVENEGKAVEKYNDRINEVYKTHENELLSARLKDLKLPDTNQYRDFYKQYHKMKVSDIGYNPDNYLRLFMD